MLQITKIIINKNTKQITYTYNDGVSSQFGVRAWWLDLDNKKLKEHVKEFHKDMGKFTIQIIDKDEKMLNSLKFCDNCKRKFCVNQPLRCIKGLKGLNKEEKC